MTTSQPTVIAISAAYGAGGPIIADRVAQALGVPFLDQLFSPAQLANQARESAADGVLRHNVRGDLAVDDTYVAPAVAELATRDVIEASDADVRALSESGGVALGRGAPRLLADSRTTLRVLLTGPVEARIAAGARHEGIDPTEAAEHQRAADASRVSVAATHYGADPDTVGLYHLVLDTTALGIDVAVQLIIDAHAALLRESDVA